MFRPARRREQAPQRGAAGGAKGGEVVAKALQAIGGDRLRGIEAAPPRGEQRIESVAQRALLRHAGPPRPLTG